MAEYLPWIISIVTGAVGGNLAGGLMKNLSLGTIGNSITGILGGGLGAWILGLVGMSVPAGGTLDIGSILGSVASGGVGGGGLMAIIGMLKGMMKK